MFLINFLKTILFLFLLSIALHNPVFIDSCWGSEIDKSKLVSLNIKDETLGDVLDKIGQITGYEINIESELVKLPITISFNNLNLHESLRLVLGKLNNYIIIDDVEKKVFLTTVGSEKKFKKDDISIVSLDQNCEQAITDRDVMILKSNPNSTDPEDVELVPPDESGGKTVTLRDLKNNEYNDLDIELVPPDELGGKTVTLRDLKKNEYNDLDIELVPPDEPGGKTVTLRDLKNNEYNDLDIELVPPNNENERGITLRDLNKP